jgi:hypothetical protein
LRILYFIKVQKSKLQHEKQILTIRTFLFCKDMLVKI